MVRLRGRGSRDSDRRDPALRYAGARAVGEAACLREQTQGTDETVFVEAERQVEGSAGEHHVRWRLDVGFEAARRRMGSSRGFRLDRDSLRSRYSAANSTSDGVQRSGRSSSMRLLGHPRCSFVITSVA
jgi:hypothetical protein